MGSKSVKKTSLPFIVLGNVIGNVVEWYTFLVYSYLAVVISNQFFPQVNETNGLVLTFLLFAAGFLARPFGALLFGYLGDSIGRKKTLLFSQIAMTVPSFFICILPTYHQIGVYAAILLAICRILQGISVAGEYTTSLCYLAEIAPRHKHGMYVSIIPCSAAVGILFSALSVFVFVSLTSESALNEWGWRFLFFIGFILSLLSSWIRVFLPETPAYLEVSQKRNKKFYPLFIKNFLHTSVMRKMLIAMPLVGVYAYFYQFYYIWNPTFLIATLHVKYDVSLLLNCVSMIIFISSIVLGGFCSDLFSKKTIIMIALCLTCVLFIPLFQFMLGYSCNFNISVFWFVLSVLFGLYVGASSVFFAEVFDTEIRSTALSITYNIPFAIVGGFTPAILALLVHKHLTEQIGYISVAIAFCGFIVAWLISKKENA